MGLVREAEGNLSTLRDGTIVITKTGARLDRLGVDDLMAGEVDEELPGASSDVAVHRRMYAEHGDGAVVHTHPVGTVPEEGGGPGEHGLYVFAASLEEAVARTVDRVRRLSRLG